MKPKSFVPVVASALLCCGAMTLVDGVIMPGYLIKSLLKITLFLLVPFLCSVLFGEVEFCSLFRWNKKGILTALLLGGLLYGMILGAYFAVSPFFDFSGIADSLTQTAGVTRDNFLWVSLYISFVNSLLEEFFFRGFIFTNLKKSSNRLLAYGISSLLFSLYHTAMMLGWFSLPLFLLVLVGLFAGGVIFNYLNERYDSLVVSWGVHMFANFSINTIGFLLLS